MFVSIKNSYVEMLTFDVMVLGGESFGKRLGSEAQMGLYEVTDGIRTLTKETLRGPWWKE
jgi:hypothetical protein